MKKSAFIFLYVLLSAACRSTGGAAAVPSGDLTGIYSAVHSNPAWNSVLIKISKTNDSTDYMGVRIPLYNVSIWKQHEETFRKLRDGMFGIFTEAGIFESGGKLQLIWTSADGKRKRFNDVFSIDRDNDIYISDSSKPAGNILHNIPDPGISDSEREIGTDSTPDLEGIYSCYSNSTGRVNVRFVKYADPENSPGTYLLSTVKEYPGFGYSPVWEGLYEGIRKQDTVTIVSAVRENDGWWLNWKNSRNKTVRRSRITTFYANGNIGTASGEGPARYIEDSLFKKIAPASAAVHPANTWISFGGLYELTVPDGDESVPVVISDSLLGSVSGGSRASLYMIRALNDSSTNPVKEEDPKSFLKSFNLFRIDDKNGDCVFRWYSLSFQLVRETAVFDFDRTGNFKIGSRTGKKYRELASFRKTPPGGEAELQ